MGDGRGAAFPWGAVDTERFCWGPQGMRSLQRPVVCAEAELPPRTPSCSPDSDGRSGEGPWR